MQGPTNGIPSVMNRKAIILSFGALLAASGALTAQDIELTDAQKAAAEAAVALQSTPKQEVKQKARYWTNSLKTTLEFGQTSLTNWAAGGYNSVSLKSFIDANANYKKNEIFWDNRLQLDYGFLYSADKPIIQKTDDRIYLESKWGYQAKDKLYYSASFSFKSQFSNSWEYKSSVPEGMDPDDPASWRDPGSRTLKSGFLSPANTNLALGLDYKPLSWFTVNFAPLTGGFTIVDDPLLRQSYSQPLKKEYEGVTDLPKLDDGTTVDGNVYKAAKFEFGAQLKMDIKVNVNDNFSYTSQILLFSDYLDDPQNIRVNWDNRIDWKIARFFSFSITTNLIYDDNVLIKNDKDLDRYPDGKQRIQFKESLTFGFVYTFASKS